MYENDAIENRADEESGPDAAHESAVAYGVVDDGRSKVGSLPHLFQSYRSQIRNRYPRGCPAISEQNMVSDIMVSAHNVKRVIAVHIVRRWGTFGLIHEM